MELYLINGPSASGKTSIGLELTKRGYKVINTDEEFGYCADLKTGEEVVFPDGQGATKGWYAKHGWIWNRDRFEQFLNNVTEPTFLCGGSLNEAEFYPKMTKIFRLVTSPEVLLARIKSRGDDVHTNNPEFIARMLKFLSHARSDAEQMGWAVVDTSTKSVTESTDEILSAIE